MVGRRPGRALGALAFVAALLGGASASMPCSDRQIDLSHPALKARKPPPKARPGHGWGQRCVQYNRVCFDEAVVVSYDAAHSPQNSTSVRVPVLDITPLRYTWAGPTASMNPDVHNGAIEAYAPLAVRPSSRLEGSPELQAPAFSNCTVPLVMWSLWPHNYGEFWTRVLARVWALQHDGAMSKATRLVVGTPAGERASEFAVDLLQPFTPHRVVSFAEFSQRPAADAPLPPAEEHTRCYQAAVLCAFEVQYPAGTYRAGQAVAEHYARRLPPNPLGFAAGTGVLKVLLEHRTGPVRNLLNWRELEARCNAAATAWRLGAASPWRRVQCRSASFDDGSTAENLVAARSADLLVVVHGAGGVNWMGMRPGSAQLEIRPFEFGTTGWGDGVYNVQGALQNSSVFWYALNVEDPTLSRPAAREQDTRAAGPRDARDRHTWLPFPALQEMVQRVAAAGGDRQRYLAQLAANQHHLELLPGGELRPKQPSAPAAAAAALALRSNAALMKAAAAAAAAAGVASSSSGGSGGETATAAAAAWPGGAGPAAGAAAAQPDSWARGAAGMPAEPTRQLLPALALLGATACMLTYLWQQLRPARARHAHQ